MKSLREPAANCAKGLAKELGLTRGDRFCIGYHIRHAFDPTAPSVGLATSGVDPQVASNLKAENDRCGLHTLNHVLDSLYYPLTVNHSVMICVRIDYDASPPHSRTDCPHFDEATFDVAEKDLLDKQISKFAGSEFKYRPRYAGMNVFNHARFPSVASATSHEELLSKIYFDADPPCSSTQTKDEESLEERTESFQGCRFYHEFVCGAQKLCHALGITPNIVAYLSLLAAILQLNTYKQFGRRTVTIMLRPWGPLEYVVGATLIADEIPSDYLPIIVNHLRGAFKHLPNVADYSGCSSDRSARTTIPENVLALLVPQVATQERGKPTGQLWAGVNRTMRSFLKHAALFSDERHEGRDVRFGLILGNAELMRYWPGPLPMELKLSLSDLPKQIHLLEDPEAQCLVIPYLDTDWKPGDQVAAKVLELSGFEEALSSWPNGALWSRDLRPYAYFTARYPWAVAVVVGPGSQMRVLTNGRLQAYRDGKGWRCFKSPIGRRRRTGSTTQNKERDALLSAAIETAIQMSPITHDGAHGGLILYAPVSRIDNSLKGKETLKFLEESMMPAGHLALTECLEPQDRAKWVTNRTLLNERNEWDQAVARLLQRAAILDGGTMLCSPRGTVWRVAQRFGFQHKAASDQAGTKRGAAASFVVRMAQLGLNDAFAIAISSDGPVRLYVRKGKNDYHQSDVFVEATQDENN